MLMLHWRAREVVHANVGVAFDPNSFDNRMLDMSALNNHQYYSI